MAKILVKNGRVLDSEKFFFLDVDRLTERFDHNKTEFIKG